MAIREQRKGLGTFLGALVMGGVLLAVTLAAARHAIAQTNRLNIQGSTTVGPIGDAFAESFKRRYPSLAISINKTGSGDGAAAIVDGRCEVAMMSRFMKATEFKRAVVNDVFPVAHVVAMDGVCVVVHPSNPVKALTTAQVRSIYTGEVANWRQLGGPDMPIVAVSRDTSSGTYETFDELVMQKQKMAAGVEYVSSNPQVHARVSTTGGAIGYVGLGFLDSKVKALTIDGVQASRSTIASGKYPISRPLFLFTNGYPKLGSPAFEFCTFHLTEEGQEIIESKGFIPLTRY